MSDRETLSLSAKGSNAVDRIRASLAGHDTDELDEVEVTLYFDRPSDDVSADDEPDESSSNLKSEQDIGRIRANTHHHRVLWAMQQLEEDDTVDTSDGISPSQLADFFDHGRMSRDNISSALSVVYNKKNMTTRDTAAKGHSWSNYYKLDDAARGELLRLGKPDDTLVSGE